MIWLVRKQKILPNDNFTIDDRVIKSEDVADTLIPIL